MAYAAALLLAVCLAAAGAVPALAQDDSPASTGKPASNDMFDDPPEKPAQPTSDRPSESPAQSSPPPGEQFRGLPPQVAPVERMPAAAPDPEAVAAKLAIRDALDRKDAPAAQRLFDDALKRFPRDRDLREVQERRALLVHDEIARSILGRTFTDGARLYGRPWLPGKTIEDGEVQYELTTTRNGKRARAADTSVNAALAKGYAYIERGDPASAEKVLSGAIRRHKDSAALHYARVFADGQSGDLKRADEDSMKAVNLSREQPVTLSQRASLMVRMGRRQEAFAWANRALEGDPRDADALVIRGMVLWTERSRPDLALVEYKKAAEIDPNQYGELYQNRIRALHQEQALISLNKKDYKQLLAETDAILASDPADVMGHTLRGLAFLNMGKVEETIKESTLALKSDPNAMWALRNRGEAMETLGARRQALADFKRAAAIDPVRFRAQYEELVRAHRDGSPPLWARKSTDGVLADSR